VLANETQFFGLLKTNSSFNGHLNIGKRRFYAAVNKWSDIKITVLVFKKLISYSRSAFTEYIGENLVNLDIGDGQAILRSVFLSGSKAGQLCVVPGKVAKLPDFERRYKAGRNKAIFEYFSDPLSVFFVGFLSTNGLYVFGVSENNITGLFEHIENGNPIFTCRFHADITAIVAGKPIGQSAKIGSKGRKAFGLVARDTIITGSSNTGDNECFVNVHSATAGENNF
jgi:hypothetical protein